MADSKFELWINNKSESDIKEENVRHLKYKLNDKIYTNRSQTISFQPAHVHTPENEQEIYEIITFAKKHNENVKVVGGGQSPNDIAMTDGHLISLARFNKITSVDRATNRVTVEAGVIISDLNERLNELGLGLPSLGSISDQTLGGLLGTGSHGSGITHGIFATTVIDLEIILADCVKVKCSQTVNTNLFKAALCSLGALGIIISATLQCSPAFALDAVQFPMPLKNVMLDITKIVDSAEFTRFWYFPHTNHCLVWQANRSKFTAIPAPTVRQNLTAIKNKLIGYYTLEFAYWIATYRDRMVPYINMIWRRLLFNKTAAQYDLSYKVFNFDCLFSQYVNEWAVPVSSLPAVFEKITEMIANNNFKVHLPIEVRFSKRDDIWLSPAYEMDIAWIGVIMYRPYNKEIAYQQYFQEFQNIMMEFGGRPHWAKIYSWWTPETNFFQKNYPKFEEFKSLLHQVDPNKIFSNSFINRVFHESDDDIKS